MRKDDELKDRLENLDVPFNPDHWKAMEKRLDLDDALESRMDDLIRSRLEKVAPDSGEIHWKQMEQLLVRDLERRRSLFWKRVTLTAAAILLLISMPDLMRVFGPEIRPEYSAGLIQATDQAMRTTEGMAQDQRPTAGQANDTGDRNQLQLKRNIRTFPGLASTALPAKLNSSLPFTREITAAGSEDRRPETAAALVAIATLPLEDQLPSPPARSLSLPGMIYKSPGRNRISMGLRTDLNYVMTPADPTIQKNAYERFNPDFGLNITYSRPVKDAWELLASLQYSSRSYYNDPVLEIFAGNLKNGYLADQLSRVDQHTVGLNLSARYNVRKYGKWNAYAKAGLTPAVVALANYDKRKVPLGTDAKNALAIELNNKTSLLSAKKYPDGFFDTGNLRDNFIFSVGGGVGMERQLSTRLSLFAETSYYYQLTQGLGPNHDRINPLSLEIGTRVSL